MYYRRNRRLIARTIALTLGLFAATLYAERGRRVAIDDQPEPLHWDGEYAVEFEGDSEGGNGWNFVPPPPPPDPPGLPPPPPPPPPPAAVDLPSGMVLRVGTKEFNQIWINANGFVSLTLNNVGTPLTFAELGAATSLAALPEDVALIAPFYADAATRTPASDCPSRPQQQPARSESLECDVVYALLDEAEPGPPDPQIDPPLPVPSFWKGMRVTWGFGGTEGGGLLQQGSTDTNAKNRFQLKLIDRSGGGKDDKKDFDIQFNYNDLLWQSDNTHVGMKVGGFTMDFGRLLKSKSFRTKYKDDCDGPSQPDPLFDPSIPFGCNSITIQVRAPDYIPKLATYTADVSMQLLAGARAPGAGPLHTTETFPLEVRISNGNDQPATNVTATLQLPSDTTIVSTPAGVTCAPDIDSATCTFGSIAAGVTLKPFSLNLHSTQAGKRDYRAVVSADQYDFNETNNISNTVSLDLAESTDLDVTGCTASPGSVTASSTVTVQCTITNHGPQTATGVSIVTSDLPAVLTFAPSAGCAPSGARVVCSPGTLASGATTTVSVRLNAVSAGSANVSATIDGDQDDLAPDNNSKSTSIAVSQQTKENNGGALSEWLLLALSLLAAARRFQTCRTAISS